MVQTRWTHLNRDYSVLTKLQAFVWRPFLIERSEEQADAFIQFSWDGRHLAERVALSIAVNWEDDTLNRGFGF